MARVDAAVTATLTTLFSFNETNGSSPNSLILGLDGNLYGTTFNGGTNGDHGTVFQFTTNGALNTLVSFNGTNGSGPVGLTQGGDGFFYGTTAQGGGSNQGTAFKLATDGTLTTLVSFNGANGAYPRTRFVPDSTGRYLYSTTTSGGSNGNAGTIFQISTNGDFASIVSFNGTNGSDPYGPLSMGPDGNLYGTAYSGGANAYGAIFQATTNGNVTVLASFNLNTTGAYPYAGLLYGRDGKYYGSTSQGGIGGYGTLFSMDTNGVLDILTSFNGTNGINDANELLQDSNGNLYGSTLYGGTNNDGGTLFLYCTNGTLTTLYTFGDTNSSSGTQPSTELVQSATNGILYGTTLIGGTQGGYGTIFQLAVATVHLQSPLLTLTNTGTSLVLSWNSVAGQTYQLQSSLTQASSSWTNDGAPVTATGTNTSTTLSASESQHFYRVQVISTP